MSAGPRQSPPAFSIQSAQERHADAIRSLVRASGLNPTDLDWPRFLVALTPKDELLGCVQIKPHHDGSRELASLAVLPQWQGRGVARALIEAILTDEKGELFLMCDSHLGPLYEKFAFSTITEEQMPTYFRRISKLARVVVKLRTNGEHLLVMRRPPLLVGK